MTQHILVLSNYLRNPIEGLVSLLTEWNASYKKNRQIRKTIRELRALSNAELADIGISRGDIYAIAHGDRDHKRTVDINSNLEGWV